MSAKKNQDDMLGWRGIDLGQFHSPPVIPRARARLRVWRSGRSFSRRRRAAAAEVPVGRCLRSFTAKPIALRRLPIAHQGRFPGAWRAILCQRSVFSARGNLSVTGLASAPGPVVFEGDSVMSITKVPIWYRYLSGCPPLRRCRSTAAATDDNAVLAHVPGIRN